jgi:hypothetical protein
MNKRKAYRFGLAAGLQFRERVANTVRTTEDALAQVLSDSPYSVHLETLNWEVMALLDFAFTHGMASAAGTVPGDSQDRSWDGFHAGFRSTSAELQYNFGRALEYVAGHLEAEIGGRQIAAVGAVFARNIGFEGNASVIAIAAKIYQDAYGLCFVLMSMKNKKVFRQKKKKGRAFEIGLAAGLTFREYVQTITRTTRDFLQPHFRDDVVAVDSGTFQSEVMALLHFALTYGMASGANDRAVNGFLRDGFLEGFQPAIHEQSICEQRLEGYVAALKQETVPSAPGASITIGQQQLQAIGAVFAKHIGYEDDAFVIAHAVSLCVNAFDLWFNQTSH